MSTTQVASDAKNHVGASTDSLLVSTPATLYYENDFSFLPPSCAPGTGAIIRCDIYNTASVRGLLTSLDLNFDIDRATAGTFNILSLVKCFDWMKIFIDNVELLWDSGTNISFLNYTRNMLLDSLDKGDYTNKWTEQGGVFNKPGDVWTEGFLAYRQASLFAPTPPGEKKVRATIPLDLLTSFLFNKWDTRLAQKISVEIKFRNNENSLQEQEFITNTSANTPVYGDLRIVNAFITQRMQLYTDAKLFRPISQMYMRPLVKTEKQIFRLPAAFTKANAVIYTPLNPMTVNIRLADNFSIHKRILGLTFCFQPDYSAFTGNTAAEYCGLLGVPNSLGAIVSKGGKQVENLEDVNKFSRQSNHFLKCMGSHWVPRTAVSEDMSGYGPIVTTNVSSGTLANDIPLHHGIGGFTLSFLDRGLASTNAGNMGASAKVDLIGGISNSVEEAWQVQFQATYPEVQVQLTEYPDFTDQLEVYMHYLEIAGIQANPAGGPSSIKVFS